MKYKRNTNILENGMATKLHIGTKIYNVKERSEILIIEKDGQQLRYLMLLEG